MALNTFGQLFTFTTWGESHGPAIGCVVDGVPPLIPLDKTEIQTWLDKRKPGQSRFTTQRKETDEVEILSGVFEGKTTGTPISLMIKNVDARSRDYGEISKKYRPGHADYTYEKKYGIRDFRGGGRASARETASRVAAGAIARKVLNSLIPSGVIIKGALVQIGDKPINRKNWKVSEIDKNAFWSPDTEVVASWEQYLDEVRKSGSSIGAIIEVRASGVPVGLGEPVYGKIDAQLAAAMMSINAVKGVNIGSGMNSAQLSGEENSDEISKNKNKLKFNSNNAGGILGGISSGQEIIVSFAVKPTSSILKSRKTINKFGKNTTISVKGRHDPCVGIRAVPVGEAMLSCVLLDHYLMDKAQCG